VRKEERGGALFSEGKEDDIGGKRTALSISRHSARGKKSGKEENTASGGHLHFEEEVVKKGGRNAGHDGSKDAYYAGLSKKTLSACKSADALLQKGGEKVKWAVEKNKAREVEFRRGGGKKHAAPIKEESKNERVQLGMRGGRKNAFQKGGK